MELTKIVNFYSELWTIGEICGSIKMLIKTLHDIYIQIQWFLIMSM